MRLIDCQPSHSDAILAILNEAIATSTALYDYHPRTPAMMAAWFESKRRGGFRGDLRGGSLGDSRGDVRGDVRGDFRGGGFPVLGMESDTGALMGFASYGTFRAWPGYKYTVEHSLYVASSFRRRGVGRALLEATIARAQAEDYHAIVGGIDSTNTASIELHTSMGFGLVATLPEVGFKFGKWRDLCFYQKLLSTPIHPEDG